MYDILKVFYQEPDLKITEVTLDTIRCVHEPDLELSRDFAPLKNVHLQYETIRLFPFFIGTVGEPKIFCEVGRCSTCGQVYIRRLENEGYLPES